MLQYKYYTNITYIKNEIQNKLDIVIHNHPKMLTIGQQLKALVIYSIFVLRCTLLIPLIFRY